MENWYKVTVNTFNKTIIVNAQLIGFTNDGYCVILLVSEKRMLIPRANIVQMKRLKTQGRQR